MQSISASEVIRSLTYDHPSPALLDVRSEGEFAEGHIRSASNIPLLRDLERHQVGLTYKERGQAAAISLGYSLFNPEKESRVSSWLSLGSEIWVTCWRGGLRSKLACEFIREAGGNPIQIEGGYKALRRELLQAFERLPPFVMISGLTGCGKTEFLPELAPYAIDLEGIARHRGSAFGWHLSGQQSTQSQFENDLALELLRHPHGCVLEDESRLIGAVVLTNAMKNRMNESPTLILEAPMQERVERIYSEYILQPIGQSFSSAHIEEKYQGALKRIRPKLGGLMYSEISKKMSHAFQSDEEGLHFSWIEDLLVHYYDKIYTFSLERHPRNIVLRGNRKECLAWIQNRFASPKL